MHHGSTVYLTLCLKQIFNRLEYKTYITVLLSTILLELLQTECYDLEIIKK